MNEPKSNDDKATHLLFQGLQLYLYENGNSTDVINTETSLKDNANNIDPNERHQNVNVTNDYTLTELTPAPTTTPAPTPAQPTTTTIRLPTAAPVAIYFDDETNGHQYEDSVTLTKAKLVKELRQQTDYINNNIDLLYLPVALPSDPISYHKTKIHEKRQDKNFINFINENDNELGDESLNITTKSNLTELQKKEENIGIDIRFNAENEETAPSTQRQVIDQEDSATLHKFAHQYTSQQAVHYATIENLPRADYGFTHPPLQSEYPSEIQNNFIAKAHIAYQPNQQYTPPQLPAPSVVHTVANYAPATTQTQPQYYSAPIITSSYSNQDSQPHSPSPSSREKVVVKIVPATGWYLNDEAERRSYYDAVSRGLLRENGYVFVNDVQRQSQPTSQNDARRHHIRSAQTFSPATYTNTYPLNYPNTYTNVQTSPVYSQSQSQSQRIPTERRFTDDDSVFHGHTSFNVPISSVSKLVGDSDSVSAYRLARSSDQHSRWRSHDPKHLRPLH